MGHLFSKSSTSSYEKSSSKKRGPTDIAIPHDKVQNTIALTRKRTTSERKRFSNKNSEQHMPIPPDVVAQTINLQIEESNLISIGQSNSIFIPTSSTVNNLSSRQIIIKIQLAKMENGNERYELDTLENVKQQQHSTPSSSLESLLLLDNTQNTQTLDAQEYDVNSNMNEIKLDTTNADRIAGSSTTSTKGDSAIKNVSSKYSIVEKQERNSNQRTNKKKHSVSNCVEYCEMLEVAVKAEKTTTTQLSVPDDGYKVCVLEEPDSCTTSKDSSNSCLRCKFSKATAMSSFNSSSSAHCSTKRLCRKCTCRDAIRRFLDPSSSSLKANKQSKERTDQKKMVTKTLSETEKSECRINLPRHHQPQQQQQQNVCFKTSAEVRNAAMSSDNALALWTPQNNSSEVIIPFNPQFVVLQCPKNSLVSVGQIVEIVDAKDNANASGNTKKEERNTLNEQTLQRLQNGKNAPKVHSQVDFMHCLVPDLEKITNSSFYWGKIDRYEAERLLEGKQEGTFLLRDSAQEEFLFSVTFRKYGRSLHARIEQNGHKFSFDCHDPCVFTASTVTGLLQHYKDPSCVMFFEPMLTRPLHRPTTFSLQQLCRATIVSHTSYDGIQQLELPARLKTYLKEYHYKQKLRVKPLDENLYACT